MAATTHPMGAQVALDVLRSGGHAVDAAVAMNAAMGFLEPTGCGLGGDLFALVWDARSRRLYGLNASGRSGRAATIAAIRERGHDRIPPRGPLAVSVPGCVSGWEALLRRFGTRPLGELLQPAIALAAEGFPVPETIAGAWQASRPLLEGDPAAVATYLPNGRAPRTGEVFANPRLARTLRRLADEGPEDFYRGRLAAEIAGVWRSAGAMLDAGDLAEHTADWVEPISTDYRGVQVWQIPPSGQGLAVLQMLNLLEGFDLAALGAGSAAAWHLMVEAKKLAYADRARWYADPTLAEIPIAELAGKAYADWRRGLIRPDAAMELPPPGDLPAAARHADTVYMAVADGEGNAVSLIQSNYMGFGSGVMAGGLGFMFQNRGTAFSLDEGHPNRLEPGKRPFHTIIPGFATRDGEPWLCFGVMGGDMQPQGQVQILTNLIDHGMDVQQAGEALRLEHIGSPTPEGLPGEGRGLVVPEPGCSEELLADLRRLGHALAAARRNGGGYQAIELRHGGVLAGASEPRRDGCALGI